LRRRAVAALRKLRSISSCRDVIQLHAWQGLERTTLAKEAKEHCRGGLRGGNLFTLLYHSSAPKMVPRRVKYRGARVKAPRSGGAEGMSRDPANAGAVAFKRAGDPNLGEFSDAVVLKKFGGKAAICYSLRGSRVSPGMMV
jgi:hypothetical protein